MSWKTFRLYPWVYCHRGINGITLYDWLNGKILSLNNEQSEILEKLIKGVSKDSIVNYIDFMDKLRDFGFVFSENIYIDNITLGSKLQNAMDFINTFHIQRLDLVLGTPCSRYDSCPLRGSKLVSHACESCLGCVNGKSDKTTVDNDKIIMLLNMFRPSIVTLSGGELFSNIPLINNILSLLLTCNYPKIVVLIVPIHAVLKFKNKIKKYANMFIPTGKRLVLTVVLTEQDIEDVPKILELVTELDIQLVFTLYVCLDKFHEKMLDLDILVTNSILGKIPVVPAFYSYDNQSILENLEKKFLQWELAVSYVTKQISIESLTNSIEHNYANCLYGNIMMKFPEGSISTCKGYYFLNHKLDNVTRTALREIMSLWEDPCKDCSLKAACAMCRSVVKVIHPDPSLCPIWRKVLEVEK